MFVLKNRNKQLKSIFSPAIFTDLVFLQFSKNISQWKHDGVVIREELQSLSTNELSLAQVTFETKRKMFRTI